jgi:hypothetical protein
VTETYRLLVTGTRHMDRAGVRLLRERLNVRLKIAMARGVQLLVVQGDCVSGVDRETRAWVDEMRYRGFPVDREDHPATNHPTQDFGDWPGCGPRRNRYMVSLGADECLAIIGLCEAIRCRRPDPHGSHGASGCADLAEAAGIRTERHDLWRVS